MPTGQQYGTNVPQTQLTSGISAIATSMPVTSATSFPTPPFTAVIDIGTSSQEPVDVTAIAGLNFTITRAIDGTSAFAHSTGATVTHADIGRDFREARAHIDATGGNDSTGHAVHGLTGTVVGTSDTQTLSNKTFSGAISMGSGNWTGTGILSENALQFGGLTGAQIQPTRLVGTISTGAAPVTGTFLLGDMIYDLFYQQLWVCTSAGSPGTWRPMGNQAVQITTSAGSINVPAWANTIKLAWNCRQTTAATGGIFMSVQLNGDTGSNYVWQFVEGSISTVSASNSGALTTAIRVGIIPQGNDAANYYGTGELVIANAQSNAYKTVSSMWNCPLSTTSGSAGSGGGLWQNTAAITSINILPVTGSFAGGSNMTLTFSA